MSFGEQVLWAQRVLEKPDAVRQALGGLKQVQRCIEVVCKEKMPAGKEAQRFYKDMLSNMLMEFAIEMGNEQC